MFFVSGVLWIVVVGLFLVGAHAHAFVCHPLYEEPRFPTLTHLLDRSGMVYKTGPLLTNLIHPGRDVQLNVGSVLSLCKEGKTAYEVFQLRHYFDLEAEVTRRTKLDLTGSLGNLKINLSEVELLSPEAEIHLSQFLNSIKIDLMPYKKEMEKPLVNKNLPALAEQMQIVAGQLRSVSASAELFRMVARLRNLISTTLHPLEKRKDDVTYQVATLDMEAMPLQRQINQSAGHLRTIQYFIHNHGSSLAEAKARGYVQRILAYTHQFSTHVKNSALHTVAPCTPVWELFDSARGVTCKGIIEPLNALWLATSWCLLLFLPAICLGLALARFFLRMDYDDDTLPLHSNGSPPGSNTNLQGGSWSYREKEHRQGYNGHHHQHNGTEMTTRRQRHTSRRNRRSSKATVDPLELVALAQVSAWRDAWRAGASFVTLELVSQNVQRPLEWVRRHWDADPRAALTGEPSYDEPPDERKCNMALSDCCDEPPYTIRGCLSRKDTSTGDVSDPVEPPASRAACDQHLSPSVTLLSILSSPTNSQQIGFIESGPVVDVDCSHSLIALCGHCSLQIRKRTNPSLSTHFRETPLNSDAYSNPGNIQAMSDLMTAALPPTSYLRE
ncbi:hypothetical protein O3P69_010742 [Scylla paramamosain]|uniref:Uncharacterized protein n=1 Tax=Scylla paramamosain TaxID=85552 RepID=A0AAW0TFX8_SCYPA